MVFDYLFFIWKDYTNEPHLHASIQEMKWSVSARLLFLPSDATKHNFFNLMNSGLVSHFGVMLQFGLCREVIYCSKELLFAPVGEDNRHNKVSISFVIFPWSLTELWYLSDGSHSSAGQVCRQMVTVERKMKSLFPFSRYGVNGRNEKPIIEVERRITVLSGSEATASSSQHFTGIRGGFEGQPQAARKWHVSVTCY